MRQFVRACLVFILSAVLLQACAPEGANRPVNQPQVQGQGYVYGNPPSYPEDQYQLTPSAERVGQAPVVKVGLLVPLSGHSAELGKALQDAAVLALFDKYAAVAPQSIRTKVELVIKDTRGDAETAAIVAKEALQEGAQLIIGPLFADSVKAVGPIAAQRGVSVISFSNNTDVARPGVFVAGFDPQEQTKRVIMYAMQSGLTDIGVFAPATAYGQMVTRTAKAVTKEFGKDAAPVVLYDSKTGRVTDEVNQLMAQGAPNGVLQFKALFLPEGGVSLNSVINTLEARGVNNRNTRLLGTGLWDDPFAQRIQGLVSGWYAGSPPEAYAAFEHRFKTTYEYTPPRLASLGYDLVALAATLAENGSGFNRQVIADANGYAGPANGIFRFKPDGTTQRGLAVIEIGRGATRVLDPAPNTFQR